MTLMSGMAAGRMLLAGILLAYPLAVYLLLDRLGPGVLGLGLIFLLALRINAVTNILPARGYLLAMALAAAVDIAVFGGATLALKSYPTVISLLLLALFGYTVLVPPSMVERIARAAGSEFSDRTVAYTRGLTIVWCLFFAINAFISAWISISGSIETWAFYNGFFAYVIMGVIFVTELIFRYFYKRHHRISKSTR
jgi:uncharacterized membrane protein